MLTFTAFHIETPYFPDARIDQFGTPGLKPLLRVTGPAMDTPYRTSISSPGGTRNGRIVHCRRASAHGESVPISTTDRCRRDGAVHAGSYTDPRAWRHRAMHGVSMAPTFATRRIRATATHTSRCSAPRHLRPVTAVPRHSTPWCYGDRPAFDTTCGAVRPDDWTQAHDVSAEHRRR